MINIIDIDEMPSVHKASINSDELSEPEVKTTLIKSTEEEDRDNTTVTVTNDKSDLKTKTELVNMPDTATAPDDMIMETTTCPETSLSVNLDELDLSSDISNTSMANFRRPSSRTKTPALRSSDFLW
jgi:hypothetical protein